MSLYPKIKEKPAAAAAPVPQTEKPTQKPVDHWGPPEISLRDYFAAAAMQGAIAHHGLFPRDTLAADCYRIADQMLEAGK
jgi:hypothetical protein